jgi:hypothetical protein
LQTVDHECLLCVLFRGSTSPYKDRVLKFKDVASGVLAHEFFQSLGYHTSAGMTIDTASIIRRHIGVHLYFGHISGFASAAQQTLVL